MYRGFMLTRVKLILCRIHSTMISQACFDYYRATDFVDGDYSPDIFFPFTVVFLCCLSQWAGLILAREIVPRVAGYRLNKFRGVFAYALSREFYKEIRGHTGRSEMNNFAHEHF